MRERGVCMRVCKHGCGVKMFCFSRPDHASTNLKKFLSRKLDTFTVLYLPTPSSAETWKTFGNMLCQFFFSFEPTFFGKHLYFKTRTDYAYKLRVQDFATGKNFSFNHCPKQKVLLFSRESYFIKATENFFPVFAYA